MPLHHSRVPESDAFRLLSNDRRRHALEYLATHEETTVSELADVVAAAECGVGSPSDSVRTAVYVSLRQSHLPRLAEADLVEFDPETNRVAILDRARGVTMYLEVVTRHGVTWAECYQYLGIVGFLVVLGGLIEAPVLGAVPVLLWATLFLAVFAAVSVYQLWSDHWTLGRLLR